MRSQDPFYKRV